MSALALLQGVALGGAWLAVRTYVGVRDTRALIRHWVRRRQTRPTLRIVGAPYEGPREPTHLEKEMAAWPR